MSRTLTIPHTDKDNSADEDEDYIFIYLQSSGQTEVSMWRVSTEFTRALVSRIESYVFPG